MPVKQATIDFCVALVKGLPAGAGQVGIDWDEFTKTLGFKNVQVAKVRYGQIKKELGSNSTDISPKKESPKKSPTKRTPKKGPPPSSLPSPPGDSLPMERTPRKAAAASKRKWEEMLKQEESGSSTEVDEVDEGASLFGSPEKIVSPFKKERLDDDGAFASASSLPGRMPSPPSLVADRATTDSGVFSNTS